MSHKISPSHLPTPLPSAPYRIPPSRPWEMTTKLLHRDFLIDQCSPNRRYSAPITLPVLSSMTDGEPLPAQSTMHTPISTHTQPQPPPQPQAQAQTQIQTQTYLMSQEPTTAYLEIRDQIVTPPRSEYGDRYDRDYYNPQPQSHYHYHYHNPPPPPPPYQPAHHGHSHSHNHSISHSRTLNNHNHTRHSSYQSTYSPPYPHPSLPSYLTTTTTTAPPPAPPQPYYPDTYPSASSPAWSPHSPPPASPRARYEQQQQQQQQQLLGYPIGGHVSGSGPLARTQEKVTEVHGGGYGGSSQHRAFVYTLVPTANGELRYQVSQ